MTSWQKAIKYLAMAFAALLCVGIFSGIIGAFSSFSYVFGNNNLNKNAVSNIEGDYQLKNSITKLNLELGSTSLVFTTGDSLKVNYTSNRLTAKEKNGELTITEKSSFLGLGNNGAQLIITVPVDYTFQSTKIKMGAGKVDIVGLSTNNLVLNLGAGETKLSSVNVNANTVIDGGAGKITISNSSLQNLDLDMGVGELNLDASLAGNSDLDLGIGAANIGLSGSVQDYTIAIDKGLGSATIDGQKVSGETVHGNGSNFIDIDGGIGNIKVSFN